MELAIDFLRASLRLTTPLLLAALGGAYMHIGGVPNVAMEGMMLIAALAAYAISFATGSWLLGLLGAMIAAMLVGMLYALFVLKLRADVFAVGITLNILCAGLGAYIIRRYYDQVSVLHYPSVALFPNLSIPFLKSYPILDGLLNGYSLLIPISIVLVLLTHLVIYKTPFGFWLWAAGSNPAALTSSGKNLGAVQFTAFMVSAAFCGLAGAHLSMGYLGMFALSLVAGRGFIALAIVLFGGGNPLVILLASLIFGIADAVSVRIPPEILPPQFPLMLPYIITILAVTLRGRFARPITSSG